MSEIHTSSQLEQPWIVYDAPPFHDEWEEYIGKLPQNMSLVHHIGLRSFWETFIWSPSGRKMNLHSSQYADFGVQLPEDEYAEAFERAKQLADEKKRILHIRMDLRGAVDETWKNTAYRQIEGHSLHKIPPYEIASEYIEVDGKLWHMRDYYESQRAQP